MKPDVNDMDPDESNHSTAVSGVSAAIIRATSSRKMMQQAQADEEAAGWMIRVWFPWSRSYKAWRACTLVCTILTVFYETYMVAFGPGGKVTGGGAILGYLLIGVFFVDLLANFNLAYYNEANDIVFDRQSIVRNYLFGSGGRCGGCVGMFWVDLIGVLPFYVLALALADGIGTDDSLTQYLSMFRLLRLVRCYRVVQLYETVQYSTKISFMTLTLSRDFAVIMMWTHIHACIFYFLARQENFDPDTTWIGSLVQDSNGMERYTVTLYWSVTTFTT